MADTSSSPSASEAVDLVLGQTAGLRCYLTGSAAVSAVRQQRTGVPDFSYSDVDLFVGSENEWIRSIQFLIDHGFRFGERMEMLWYRVLHYGTHNWHTNSMRLISPDELEVNLIYKTIGRHPTSSLSQVLETFDFGLLSLGWETETGTYRDARPYQFPGMDVDGPLPMLPWRREAFEQGHFREHQGLRTFGRAARYFNKYGFDGSLVVPSLVRGYHNAADYFEDRTQPEQKTQGQLYRQVALLLEGDENDQPLWDKLAEASDLIPRMDTLDEIYQFLIEP